MELANEITEAMPLESNTESTRKLASIQIIDKIEPHTGANALELATILGWKIITRIGEAVTGTKVIYCEIDSLLPVDAEWLPQAIKDRILKERPKHNFRVKTIKLRGEISQGLIIPIVNSLPSLTSGNWNELTVGTDVTDLLGINKYEPPIFTGGILFQSKNGGPFPSRLLDKTDEPRVQSIPELFTSIQNKPYYMTVKLDGTSVTYLFDPKTNDFMVCSRNMIRKRPNDLDLCPYWSVVVKYDLENKLRLNPHLAIQGEICGPHIQKNLLGLQTFDLFVFNIVDIRDKSRLRLNDMIDFCRDMGISHVPIEEVGDYFHYSEIKDLLIKAKGKYIGTKNAREGLVIRSADQSISFKAINNEYLLKHGY